MPHAVAELLDRLTQGEPSPLDPRARADLGAFVELLLRWNERINLTGAADAEEVVGLHLPDAFAAGRVIPPGSSVVDIGSGGGLPGVPLAIIRRDVRVDLVEPRAKRAAFLREASRRFGLGGTVREERSEALPPGAWQVAMSRATFAPEIWLDEGRRLVAPGGTILLFTGGDSSWKPPEGARCETYQARGRARRLWRVDVPRETSPLQNPRR